MRRGIRPFLGVLGAVLVAAGCDDNGDDNGDGDGDAPVAVWSDEEIAVLAAQFGLPTGYKLHEGAEDYHFPQGSFLTKGYSPPGGYVKDFSLVVRDGRLHLFHIDGRPGQVCYVTGNEISFGHASTSDYRRWIRHQMPLAVGERPWESEHIWAPFVYERQGVSYMFYMGHGPGGVFISYATSTDLCRWTRWSGGPILCAVGRDPFVFADDARTVLLYTGYGGARVAAAASQDMVVWQPLPDVITIPGGEAAESCSMHLIEGRTEGRYVLWFNDFGPGFGFRAAYVFSDDPFHFDASAIREFRFVTDNPAATPSAELPVILPTPLSIELIATSSSVWFVAYFRWHVDRNRLFFGSLDWSSDPAVITEIGDEDQLQYVLDQIN
jgi:hypothetical protein